MTLLEVHPSNCEQKVRLVKKYLSPSFRKPKQVDRRAPKFLTEKQVEDLIKIAYTHGQKRNRKRNALLLFMLFRHGLRRNEAITLQWSQINLEDAQLCIYRLKNGKMCNHPIPERELRMIGEHKKTCFSNKYVFSSFQGVPLSEAGIKKVIDRIAKKSNIPYRVHPHMFRHACGYYLANKGIDTRAIQEYLGHKDITKTVIYTEMAPNRFNKFWKS